MNSGSTPRLEPAIRQTLAPALRTDGFSGSGRRFCSVAGPWIRVVTVQGSRWGGMFAVNLGIHFAGLPDAAGNQPDPKQMSEAHCAFRRRLSDTNSDRWWKHDPAADSILASIQSATEIYLSFGRACFAEAIHALEIITPESLAAGTMDLRGFGNTKVQLGLALARIRQLQGRVEERRAFAQYGLQYIGVAQFLNAELEALAA